MLAFYLSMIATAAAGAALIREIAAMQGKRRAAALRAVRVRAELDDANRSTRRG